MTCRVLRQPWTFLPFLHSTSGDLLVLSSLAPGNQATYGLETIFHEGMHQWDNQVIEALQIQAKKANKSVPRNLSHSLIFFTAGEAIRRVAPEHVPYAEKFGVWQRGLGSMKVALEEVWKPYLDGHGSRDEAFAELIKRTAIESPHKQLVSSSDRYLLLSTSLDSAAQEFPRGQRPHS